MNMATITVQQCDRCGALIREKTADSNFSILFSDREPVTFHDLCVHCFAALGRLYDSVRVTALPLLSPEPPSDRMQDQPIDRAIRVMAFKADTASSWDEIEPEPEPPPTRAQPIPARLHFQVPAVEENFGDDPYADEGFDNP
jgi:hypothetical protein